MIERVLICIYLPYSLLVNILLNYGSTTCPPEIAKISPGTPSQIEQQLEEAVARNLDFQVGYYFLFNFFFFILPYLF